MYLGKKTRIHFIIFEFILPVLLHIKTAGKTWRKTIVFPAVIFTAAISNAASLHVPHQLLILTYSYSPVFRMLWTK